MTMKDMILATICGIVFATIIVLAAIQGPAT